MMKKMMVLALAGLLAVNAQGDKVLEGAAANFGNMGFVTASNQLSRLGLTDPEDIGAVMASWDEETVVERALEAKAFALLVQIARFDDFSGKARRRIEQALLLEAEPPSEILSLVPLFPVGERLALENLVERHAERNPGNTPAFTRHNLRYALLRGERPFTESTDPGDMARVLLAPEGMNMQSANIVKVALREAAVVLARRTLRSRGQSFVLQDGVNPLIAAIEPVVAALNAPGARGLEVALRELGADIADIEREELDELADEWQAEIMAGDLSGARMNAVIGKLSIALGVEGFNQFVESYNHGTKEREDKD